MWFSKKDGTHFKTENTGSGLSSTLIGAPIKTSHLPEISEEKFSLNKLVNFSRSKDDEAEKEATEKAIADAEKVDLNKRDEEVARLDKQVDDLLHKIDDINNGGYIPSELEQLAEMGKDDKAVPKGYEPSKAELDLSKFSAQVNAERKEETQLEKTITDAQEETKLAEAETKALLKTHLTPDIKRELKDYLESLKVQDKTLKDQKKDVKLASHDIKEKEKIANQADMQNSMLIDAGFY